MDKIMKDCEICKAEATCLCYECYNYYCERCFKMIHDVKNDPQHKKESIDLFVPIDLKCPKHPKKSVDLFCLNEKGKTLFIFNFILETCCLLCHYKNLHKGHILIELSDIENLKKENITLESVSNNFTNIYEKIVDIKNKIEKEIEKINNLYEKTFDELTNYYLQKHEQLIKEENDLKEKLQIEVTKSKEKLEKYFSETNNNIKLSERIMKAIKKL